MRRIVIIGAGGHAREILEILLACREKEGNIKPIGFIDEDPDKHGQVISGFPVLGDFRWFSGVDRSKIEVICAVGTPQVCRKLTLQAKRLGLRFTNVISPAAHISPYASIGQGVAIFPNVVVNTGVKIGNNVTINVASTVSHDTVVGDFCNINPGVHLAGNVTIGEGCYIGMGADVIQGVVIGPWSTIGAGAVVIRNVPSYVTAVGVPARVIKTHRRKEDENDA